MTHRSCVTHVALVFVGLLPVDAAPGLTALAQDAPPGPASRGAAAPSPSGTPGPLAGIEILVRGDPDPDPVVSDADLRTLVLGNTDFGLDLYREVADQPGNLVLGPLSISVAMAMNHVGAHGTTAAQIEQAMHLGLLGDRLDAAFDRLVRDLKGLDSPGVETSMVSQLFGQRGYPFDDAFLVAVADRYAAPLAVVDYQGDAEAARVLINRWVASRTSDRITVLIPTGVLDGLTRLVLVNAMYLKADWAVPFNAARTKDRSFQLRPGKQVRVPTMTKLVRGPTVHGPGYRAIELPYAGDRLAVLIVVPRDMVRFQRSLTGESLETMIAALRDDQVDLTMPTFSARTAVDLVGPLTALGIHDAFDPARADLSGISDEPGLHIGAAVHQAFIKVAEQGTEAAAATAIGDTGTSGPPPRFRIDRPFLWFIRDRVTGSILFLGRVTDPRATAE